MCSVVLEAMALLYRFILFDYMLDASIHKKAGLSKCASSSESQWNTAIDYWPIVGALLPPFQTHFSEQLEISGLLERDVRRAFPGPYGRSRQRGPCFSYVAAPNILSFRRHPRNSLSFALPKPLPRRPLHSTVEYFCLGILLPIL